VVAIKKVKLDGMEKKAIDGYANEISLLKRLRGNPAIIQMYDSEVDLARKSIFVVMELGEADLNHILQQRALSGGCRSLNMNFIRLTWQQMLSAVHCIHEERIIHSDLKPANFLFVRGALKLIDFGIAKAIQSDDTTNIYRESHIGTLNYMSPEAILDTETGSNGPRMRIGRVSRNDAVRLRMSRISTNRYLSTHDAGFRCLVPRLHPLRNGTWQDAIR
jgi:serine/threonine protein kinase